VLKEWRFGALTLLGLNTILVSLRDEDTRARRWRLMRIHPLDLIIVVVYLLGVTLLGLRFRQQQHSVNDYFL
jgi:hypothetical protein